MQNKTTILIGILIQLKCSNNEKELKQYSKLKAYLVFTRMFNVFGQIIVSTQALFHSCLPFLDFLGEIMHFCKYAWIDLMDIYFKFLQFFSSIVPYWDAFEKTWLKQVP